MSAVSQEVNLQRTLRRWDIRRRLAQSLIWLPRGLAIGLIIALSVALLSRWRPLLLPDEILRTAIGVTVLAGVITLGIIWARPRSVLWLARYFDLHFGLKERVSTALELSSGLIPPAETLGNYQFEDTRRAVTSVDLREKLPLRLKYIDWLLLAILLILLGLTFYFDNPLADQIVEERQIDQAIQEQVEALENVREEILANEDLSAAEQQQLTQPIDEALETLKDPNISREEAVAALSEAEQQIEEYTDGLSEEEQQALEQAGQELNQSEAADDVSDALSESNLGEAASELENLGEMVSEGELSPEEMAELAEALEAAAESLQETNPEAAQALQEAAEALREGDLEAAQEALNEAAEALREQQEQAGNSPQAEAAQEAQQQVEESRQEVAQAGQEQNQQFAQQNQESQQGQQGEQQPSQNQTGQQQPQEGQQGQQSQSDQQQPQTGQQPGQQGQQGEQGQQSQQSESGDPSQPGSLSQSGQSQESSGQTAAQSSQSGQTSSQQADQSAGNSPGGVGSDVTQGQAGQGEGIDTDNAPGEAEGLQTFDQIFAPSHIGQTGQEQEVQVQGDPQDEEGQPMQEADFNEDFSGEAYVDYGEVFADYQNSVNEALDTDYIPLGLRDVIHDYFTSLEP